MVTEKRNVPNKKRIIRKEKIMRYKLKKANAKENYGSGNN